MAALQLSEVGLAVGLLDLAGGDLLLDGALLVALITDLTERRQPENVRQCRREATQWVRPGPVRCTTGQVGGRGWLELDQWCLNINMVPPSQLAGGR